MNSVGENYSFSPLHVFMYIWPPPEIANDAYPFLPAGLAASTILPLILIFEARKEMFT